MDIYGAVELGGTKTLVTAGTADGTLGEVERLETGADPASTLAKVVELLSGFDVSAVGVASFGPLDLRPDSPSFGSILATPKPGWANQDLVSPIAALGVPVAIDTDVNGAAIAEGEWGAARGLESHAYITVGTGIGAGIVVGGAIVHGLTHPELGHLPVQRADGDDFAGICPYHGDCLEGMASGPALFERFGRTTSQLAGEDAARALHLVSSYLAQGVRSLVYTVSPERVVIGGGVSKTPGFHRSIHEALIEALGGYGMVPTHRDPSFIAAPGLGEHSGLVGGLLLARRIAGGG